MRSSLPTTGPRVRGRFPAVLVAMALTATTMAGCGAQDEPKPAPAPTSEPSEPPGLDTEPPRKPAQAETRKSAADYGRYLALLVQHAIRIRNVRPVMGEAMDQAKCTTCRQLSEFIEQELRDDKVWEVGPDLRLGRFSARREGGGFEVNGAFDYPRGRFVSVDGTEQDVAPGGPFVFAADLVWDADGSRWRVLDYSFLDKSKG